MTEGDGQLRQLKTQSVRVCRGFCNRFSILHYNFFFFFNRSCVVCICNPALHAWSRGSRSYVQSWNLNWVNLQILEIWLLMVYCLLLKIRRRSTTVRQDSKDWASLKVKLLSAENGQPLAISYDPKPDWPWPRSAPAKFKGNNAPLGTGRPTSTDYSTQQDNKKLHNHVVNHCLTLREAGLRVQPNLSRYTVASVIRTFRLENRYCKNIIISKTSARFQ